MVACEDRNGWSHRHRWRARPGDGSQLGGEGLEAAECAGRFGQAVLASECEPGRLRINRAQRSERVSKRPGRRPDGGSQRRGASASVSARGPLGTPGFATGAGTAEGAAVEAVAVVSKNPPAAPSAVTCCVVAPKRYLLKMK